MKIALVFETSEDVLPFEVVYNQNLIKFFIESVDKNLDNNFFVNDQFVIDLDSKLADLNWSIAKTNEILYTLIDKTIEQQSNIENYLNQSFLNKTHYNWVMSQKEKIDIDNLLSNKDINKAKIGKILHEIYPDHIRIIKTAEAMEKLGYIFPYEEINMNVHRLEKSFSNIEFRTHNKWQVIENPFFEETISNNDVVNLSFGYTYVGRQYYNKFKFFDLDLTYKDDYNYETLEFAFQLNLNQPETIPFSKESLKWAEKNNIKLIAEQIPIANLIDLEKNLFDYRKILYTNLKQGNKAKLIIQ